ncbi:hypothetical protein D3C87_363840 [compost metagenome]
MITSPWNSTVLRQHRTGEIISELAVAKAMGGLVADGPAVVLVTPAAEKIDTFILPITSEEYGSRKLNENGVVFMDGRSFMRKEQRSATGFIVANQTQADFTVRLGELTALWVKDLSVRDDFLRVGDLAPQTFIAWIAGLITGKLGVDEVASREIQIITGLFYIHQFYGADEALSTRGKETSMKLIQRWTRAPIQLIQGIVEAVEYMPLLENYVAELRKQFASNTRIVQVNVGFITMSLGRSWFGWGAQEICGVALEYPPAFLALVEAAANTKVWRKNHLGGLVQRLAVNEAGMAGFVKSMEILAGKVRQMSVSMESFEAGAPAIQADIDKAQKELSVKFAPDYVAFLKKFGVLSVGSHEIYGLGPKAGHLDVVAGTKEIAKYFKTNGLYVIESVGVDSVFIAADSKGNLFEVSPTGETPMKTTFSKYLDEVIAGND